MATQMSAYAQLPEAHTGIRVVVCEPDAAVRAQLRSAIEGDPLLIVTAEARNWIECQACLDDFVPELLIARSDMIPAGWRNRNDRDTFLPVVITLKPTLEFPHGRRYTDLRLPADMPAIRKSIDRAVCDIYDRKARQLRFLVDRYVAGSREFSTYKSVLSVERDGRTVDLSTDEVVSIVAARKHVAVHSTQGSFILREPIHEVAEELDPRIFVRIHRSVIISLRHVMPAAGEKPAFVDLADGSRYPVGPNYRDALANALHDGDVSD